MQNTSISLIEFSVENFKIFKNRVTFSMSSQKSDHTFARKRQNLLRTSLVYGPNASGKSTLLDAINALISGILNSANNPGGQALPYHPFLLANSNKQPSFYEVIFSFENKIFKYSFSTLEKTIITENLSEILSTGREKAYLIRNKHGIKLLNGFKKSEDVKIKTREDVLFLAAASQWNNEIAIKIVNGFKNINVISGPDSGNYRGYTIKLLEETDKKKKILDFLKKADFCIDDVTVGKVELPDAFRKRLMRNLKNFPSEIDTVYFSHSKFDSSNQKIGFEKFNIGDESEGTQKFFNVLGPIIDTIENGKVLFIDEFDNSLHPLLTKFIIDLFENNNPKNAQLIVTTHDTNLLSYKNFIKDQFWFTEKDKFGAGNLFSLAEFDLRNDTEYSKKYLEGRFGALPFIQNV
ncbi:MAG: ATP-binding protein [Patescibacteria group bacterium]|nr:ATP-binding protein [Patescibacteria group bacterium]